MIPYSIIPVSQERLTVVIIRYILPSELLTARKKTVVNKKSRSGAEWFRTTNIRRQPSLREDFTLTVETKLLWLETYDESNMA